MVTSEVIKCNMVEENIPGAKVSMNKEKKRVVGNYYKRIFIYTKSDPPW